MKQLINKFDSSVRLVGLDDVSINANTGATHGDPTTMFFTFGIPTSVGVLECVWSGESWNVADYNPPAQSRKEQGESEVFASWLENTIRGKNYTLTGVSRAMGFSASWLWNIVRGKRRLPKKRYAELEKALDLPNGTIARIIKKSGNKAAKIPTI